MSANHAPIPDPFSPFAAGLLLRVSTPGQVDDGLSLPAQEEQGRQCAARLSLPVLSVYSDEGISGDLFTARPALQSALADLKAGRFNVLIARDLSRVTRNPEHLGKILKAIDKAGGRLYLISHASYVNRDDYHQMFGLGVLNQADWLYRMHTRKMVKDGRREAAEEGRQPNRVLRPYGYRIVQKADVIRGTDAPGTEGTYVVINAEAAVYRQIVQWFDLEGASLRDICNRLNDAATPTMTGAIWRPNTIKRLLSNPVFKGEARSHVYQRNEEESRLAEIDPRTQRPYRGRVYQTLAPAALHVSIPAPALIDAVTWERLQAQLQANREKFAGRNDRRALLSGLIVCPVCGLKMFGWKDSDGRRYFRCRHNAPSNAKAAGVPVCHPSVYPMAIYEQLAGAAVQALVTRPDLLTEAIEAYLADESKRRQPEEDAARIALRLESKLRSIEAKRATVLNADAPPEFLADALKQIGAEWKEVTARLAEARKQRPKAVEVRPVLSRAAAAQKVSSIFVLAAAILTDEAADLMDRHRVLRGLAETLIPDREEPDPRKKKRDRGLTLVARGPFEGPDGVLVPHISVWVTVSGRLTVTVPVPAPSLSTASLAHRESFAAPEVIRAG